MGEHRKIEYQFLLQTLKQNNLSLTINQIQCETILNSIKTYAISYQCAGSLGRYEAWVTLLIGDGFLIHHSRVGRIWLGGHGYWGTAFLLFFSFFSSIFVISLMCFVFLYFPFSSFCFFSLYSFSFSFTFFFSFSLFFFFFY